MGGTSREDWLKRWHGQPLRLLVTCHCEGYDPWFIQREVRIDHPPQARIRVIESEAGDPDAVRRAVELLRKVGRTRKPSPSTSRPPMQATLTPWRGQSRCSRKRGGPKRRCGFIGLG